MHNNDKYYVGIILNTWISKMLNKKFELNVSLTFMNRKFYEVFEGYYIVVRKMVFFATNNFQSLKKYFSQVFKKVEQRISAEICNYTKHIIFLIN